MSWRARQRLLWYDAWSSSLKYTFNVHGTPTLTGMGQAHLTHVFVRYRVRHEEPTYSHRYFVKIPLLREWEYLLWTVGSRGCGCYQVLPDGDERILKREEERFGKPRLYFHFDSVVMWRMDWFDRRLRFLRWENYGMRTPYDCSMFSWRTQPSTWFSSLLTKPCWTSFVMHQRNAFIRGRELDRSRFSCSERWLSFTRTM